MWYHEDVRGDFSLQRNVGAADLDHERRQPLMQPYDGTGHYAESGQAVESPVRTRGDEDDAKNPTDGALAERRHQRKNLTGEPFAAPAPRNRPVVWAGWGVPEEGTYAVRGFLREDVGMLQLTGPGFHGFGVEVYDIEQQPLRQPMSPNDAGGALLALKSQLGVSAPGCDPTPSLCFRNHRRSGGQSLCGYILCRSLLSQRPKPFEQLFDLNLGVVWLHAERSDLPSQRESQRVSRLEAGTS